MRPEDLDRIRGLPLFSALQPECFEQLMEPSFLQRFPAAVELVREGDAGDFMMLIIEGRTEIFKQDRWNSPRMIAVLDAGQTVGEMSMIDGEPRFASCISAERCTVAMLTRESLARIILEQPVLGAKILMELVLMLSKRLRITSAKLVGYMDKYESGDPDRD